MSVHKTIRHSLGNIGKLIADQIVLIEKTNPLARCDIKYNTISKDSLRDFQKLNRLVSLYESTVKAMSIVNYTEKPIQK